MQQLDGLLSILIRSIVNLMVTNQISSRLVARARARRSCRLDSFNACRMPLLKIMQRLTTALSLSTTLSLYSNVGRKVCVFDKSDTVDQKRKVDFNQEVSLRKVLPSREECATGKVFLHFPSIGSSQETVQSCSRLTPEDCYHGNFYPTVVELIASDRDEWPSTSA